LSTAFLVTLAAWSSADEFVDPGSPPTRLERAGIEAPDPGQPLSAVPLFAEGIIVEATLVLQVGDDSGGAGIVTTLNQPFVNGIGDPGFTGNATENFVWSGAGVIWVSSNGLPSVLTGAEFTMGIGDLGEFIYSPSTDGSDSVWTDLGLLAIENVQAPGMPTGTNSTFHSRPTMIPSGQAYWVAGHGDGSGGTTSVGRILYTSSDGSPTAISIILRTGDTIDGQIVDATGVDFDYDFSDNAGHHIHVLDMVGSTATDGFVYVDGALIAREGDPNGSGVDNWDNFDFVSINSAGSYLFSGDTDGDTNGDEFIARNGVIVLREGDTVAGITLEPGAAVRGVAINDSGETVFGWASGGIERLFFAGDAADIPGTAALVLSTGDEVDLDGDGTGDATVTDLPATILHNFQLADDGRFFIGVDLDYGAGDVAAIIGLDLPSAPLIFSDGFESGDTSAWSRTAP
jgi:hypothetical protein